MVATVETVAREAIAAVDSTAGILIASQWVARRYQQLASRARFRHLRRVGEVVLPAAIDDGTVTVTRGSKTVTGNAAAQTAWGAAKPGYFFRTRTAWYQLSSVGTELRLLTEFAEDDVTDAAYKIVQRHVRLNTNVRWLGSEFVHYRLRRPLRRRSLIELNIEAPERQLVGTPPDRWAEVGEDLDSDGNRVKTVEFYPWPQDSELVYYVYWQAPPELTLDEFIPPNIDPHVIKEGALIDVMRYEASKAARAGQIEAASYWRNESRTQATAWERFVMDAIRTDRGTDDVTFILESIRGGSYGTDIVTARDEIFSRGARP